MADKVENIREEVERLQKRAEHNFDISLTEIERQFWLGESNVLTLIGKYIDTMQEDSQEQIIKSLKKFGWGMYNAYHYLTTDASHVRKAMKEWYDFINYNLDKHEEQNPSNAERTGKDCNITGIKSKKAEGKLKECIESITEESLTKAHKQLEQESVSGEFEKEFEEMFKQYCKEAPVRFSHDMYKIKDIARHFANWQKEQMMEGAIECYIRRNKCTKKNVLNGFDVTCDAVQQFNGGDKVKVIVIKEE